MKVAPFFWLYSDLEHFLVVTECKSVTDKTGAEGASRDVRSGDDDK